MYSCTTARRMEVLRSSSIWQSRLPIANRVEPSTVSTRVGSRCTWPFVDLAGAPRLDRVVRQRPPHRTHRSGADREGTSSGGSVAAVVGDVVRGGDALGLHQPVATRPG